MKRHFVYALVSSIVFTLSSCSLSVVSRESFTDTNSDSQFSISNLGGSMELNAYIPESQPENLTLSNVGIYSDEFVVFYYDLGVIKRTPVYTSMIVDYDNQDMELDFSFDKCEEETISNSTSLTCETVDTHSFTGGFQIGFEQAIEAEYKVFGTGVKGTFTTSQSADFHWTNNWGTTTIESQNQTNSYVTSYSKGLNIKLNINENSGFRRNYSYRLSFYESVHLYGVLYYDLSSKEYTVCYENLIMPGEKRMVLEESNTPTRGFDYKVEKTIPFDLDKAKELAEANMPDFDDVIRIKDAQSFYNCMMGDTTGKSYLLDCNGLLDLSMCSWAPLPAFKGTLDGGNTIIKNWKVRQTGVGDYGLFEVNEGYIHDLELSDCSIYNEDPDTHGTLNAGLLCGRNKGSIAGVTIHDSSISVDVGSINSNYNNYVRVGVLTGSNEGNIDGIGPNDAIKTKAEIRNNIVNAYAGTQYEGSQCYIGGITGITSAGFIDNYNSHGNTFNATAKGDVRYGGFFNAETGHGRPYAYVGGIAGYCTNTTLGNGLISTNNSAKAECLRDCSHDTNKGSNIGTYTGYPIQQP